MMKIDTIFIVLLTFMILSSCENEIIYNHPENEPKLILNALIDAEKSDNYIYLNLSGTYKVQQVPDALVKVYVNGEYKEDLISHKQEEYFQKYIYPVKTKFIPGDKVRIEATTKDGKYHVWSETTVPFKPEIIHIDTTSVKIKEYYDSSFYEDYYQFKITIKDDSKEKRYYRLISENTFTYEVNLVESQKDTVIAFKRYAYIAREDIALNEGRPGAPVETDLEFFMPSINLYGIFDNTYFKDNQYTLTINLLKQDSYYYNVYWPEEIEKKKFTNSVKIGVQAITKEEYLHLKALNYYHSDTYDEFLSEPVHFPSNVNGGLGILGIHSEDNVEMFLKEFIYEEDNNNEWW